MEIRKANLEIESEKLKNNAAELLDRMFGIQKEISNGTSRRIVDYVVGAAILEITSVMTKATNIK